MQLDSVPGTDPVIFTYTREQALDDGVLIDVSEMAKEAGIKFPVALTNAVYETLRPTPEDHDDGQSIDGRLWDLLMLFRVFAKKEGGSEIDFYIQIYTNRKHIKADFKALCHPGDNMEPVITIMLPNED